MFVNIFVFIYKFNTQLKSEKEREKKLFDYCGRSLIYMYVYMLYIALLQINKYIYIAAL